MPDYSLLTAHVIAPVLLGGVANMVFVKWPGLAVLKQPIDGGRLAADGRRHVYQATVPRDDVRGHALGRVLSTFFEDSPEALLTTLLSRRERRLKPEEVARLRKLLDEHGKKR